MSGDKGAMISDKLASENNLSIGSNVSIQYENNTISIRLLFLLIRLHGRCAGYGLILFNTGTHGVIVKVNTIGREAGTGHIVQRICRRERNRAAVCTGTATLHRHIGQLKGITGAVCIIPGNTCI